MVGLEMASAFVVGLIAVISVAVFIEPYIGLFLTIFISTGVEGRLIESFVLFRFFGFNWYLMDLVLLVVFLSISIRLVSGVYTIRLNSVIVWIGVFFFTCLIGVFWGLKAGNPSQTIFYDLRGFFYYIFFLPAAFLLSDYRKLKTIFVFIIIVGTLKCLADSVASIYFTPRSYDVETQEYLTFARLIGYTEIIYPIIFVASTAYFLLNNSLKTRLLFIPVIAISGLALFLSYTRGSWLAAFMAIILLLFFLVVTKRIKINYTSIFISLVLFSLLLLMMDFFNIFALQRIAERATSVSLHKVDISNLGRLVEYATALEAFFKNPVLGAGLGLKFNYFAPGIGFISSEYCHNSYLYVLAKMGLVGLLPFVMILVSSIRVGYLVLVGNIDEEEAKLVFIFIIILLMIAIKSFTTWHLNTLTFSPFVGILFGICYQYKNKIKLLSDKQSTIH